jgi:hypothetical protein
VTTNPEKPEDLIAQGRHRALVRASFDAVQFGITKGVNAKEQVVVLFDFTDQKDPDYGKSISWFGYFSDKTIDRTLESLRYCGWQGDEIAELPDIAAAGGLNEEVELVVEHEFYQRPGEPGEWQEKVRWVNRPGGSGAIKLERPLEGRELASFSARMKSRARMVNRARPASGASSHSAPAHPNAPGNNEDIPF